MPQDSPPPRAGAPRLGALQHEGLFLEPVFTGAPHEGDDEDEDDG